MSSDNGIYYAEFPDGYRVIHAQAIDNLWYYPEGSKRSLEIVKQYFGDTEAIPESELQDEIKRLNDIYTYTEYGIQYLGQLSFE